MAVTTRANLAFYNGGSGSVTVTYPTIANSGGYRLEVGQLMLLTVYVASAGNLTAPSGWTAVNASSPTSGSSGAIYQYVRIATASDIGGSLALTVSYSNAAIYAHLRTYRGHNVSTTVVNTISAGTDATNKYKLAGAITPSAVGALPIVVAVNSNSASIASLPVGWSAIQYLYPNDNYKVIVIAEGPLTTDITTPINPQVTWKGQFSNFNLVTALTLINPAAPTAAPLVPTEAPAIAAAISASQIEAAVSGGSPSPVVSALGAFRLIGAVAFGANSGAATSTPSYSDPSGTRQRVTHTLDTDNNRTGVTVSTT